MIRFLVYINNKLKIDDQFLFYATVRLTKPYPPLVNNNTTITSYDTEISSSMTATTTSEIHNWYREREKERERESCVAKPNDSNYLKTFS